MADQLHKNQSYAFGTSRDNRSQRETPNRLKTGASHSLAKLVKIAEKRDLTEGSGRVVNVEGRSIALFRVKDEYFALANVCLHRGGPLGEGSLNGSTITCPWHGWKFDVRTGSFTVIPTLKVTTYKVREQNGSVMVEIP
ncbi:non-heme iron oxygenase ferredoxin subunit [Candidatus Bathyarchaeota archaeon]|nr:MAG: non-heme iron oxygenase ferredoxin subunit [Candidatus Bathyarchaeota archaeon]